MSSKYALSVSLTERLCAFIKHEVASGRYGTASEVVRTALRQLEADATRPLLTSAGQSKPFEDEPSHAPVSASAGSRRNTP